LIVMGSTCFRIDPLSHNSEGGDLAALRFRAPSTWFPHFTAGANPVNNSRFPSASHGSLLRPDCFTRKTGSPRNRFRLAGAAVETNERTPALKPWLVGQGSAGRLPAALTPSRWPRRAAFVVTLAAGAR
jgi:hypothetical protein